MDDARLNQNVYHGDGEVKWKMKGHGISLDGVYSAASLAERNLVWTATQPTVHEPTEGFSSVV